MAQILAPFDIHSVHSRHPQLPQYLVRTFKLDSGLVHNAPVTPKLIKEAELTAQSLQQIQDFHAPITDEVVQTAKSRALSISQVYTSAELHPPAGAWMEAINTLQDGQERMEASLQRIEESLASISAWKENARIGDFNKRKSDFDTGTVVYRAKLKEVPGDGAALANELALNNTTIAALAQRPVVGTPFSLTIEPHILNLNMIMQLIRFYNEDFRIERIDSAPVRVQKVRQWLISGL